MPLAWLNEGVAHAWEQGGRFYERIFGIKRWKGLLPDAARWFHDGFAKRTMAGTDADYLRQALSDIRKDHRASRQAWTLRYALDGVHGSSR
jgi:glycosyl-4,4'-diaponeurosporenoate acyltransferase